MQEVWDKSRGWSRKNWYQHKAELGNMHTSCAIAGGWLRLDNGSGTGDTGKFSIVGSPALVAAMIEMRVGNCKAGGCKDCKNNLHRVSVPPKLPGSLALLSAGESTFVLQDRTRLESVIGLVITYVPVNNAGGPGMRTPTQVAIRYYRMVHTELLSGCRWERFGSTVISCYATLLRRIRTRVSNQPPSCDSGTYVWRSVNGHSRAGVGNVAQRDRRSSN
jgi:hypothetical protein